MRISRVIIALVACMLPAHAASFPERPKYEVVGYVFGPGRTLDASIIAATKMTRINYAFFALKDGVIAERGVYDAENLAALTEMRKGNPQLQILISVGGGDVGSAGFSDMAITPKGRRKFLDSAVAAVEKYGLDGVDIDWEYPGYTLVKTTTVRAEDRKAYTLLLKELRQRLDLEQKRLGRPLVTSSATGATQIWLDHTDMRAASKWLTTVNMMCYDWYSNVEKYTSHDSPLHTVAADPKHISIDDAVKRTSPPACPRARLSWVSPFMAGAGKVSTPRTMVFGS